MAEENDCVTSRLMLGKESTFYSSGLRERLSCTDEIVHALEVGFLQLCFS